MIVEGQEDPAVWRELIKKANLPANQINVQFVRNGGWAEASKAAGLLRLLAKLGVSEVPFLLVLEADEDEGLKRDKLNEYALTEDDYVILPLDIEAYLTDSPAIACVTGSSRAEVTSVLRKTKGRPSKQRLERIFEELGSRGLSHAKRRRLAAALRRLPPDILRVTDMIRAKLSVP